MLIVNKNKLSSVFVFLFMVCILLVLSGFVSLHYLPKERISSFLDHLIKKSVITSFSYKNTKKTILELGFERSLGKIFLVNYHLQPELSEKINADSGTSFINISHNKVNIELPLEFEMNHDIYYITVQVIPYICIGSESYSLQNLIPSNYCSERIQYISLLRQTENYTKKYGFNSPYTVYSSGNLLFKSRAKNNEPSPLYPHDKVSIVGDYRVQIPDDINFPELREATSILSYIYSTPIYIGGGASMSEDDFLRLPPKQRLDLVWSGQFRVSCAGVRDIWLDIAKESDILSGKVRHVSAYQNELLSSSDLVFKSHALVEVYIEQLEKWVVFDPWFGVVLHEKRELLSADDMVNKKSYNSDRLDYINLVSPNINIDNEAPIFNLKDYCDFFGLVRYGPKLFSGGIVKAN